MTPRERWTSRILIVTCIGAASASAQAAPAGPVVGAHDTVVVPAIAMVSRQSQSCLNFGGVCVPSPGREANAPGGGGGALAEAQGSLFASVALPAGARLTSIEIVGIDPNIRNNVDAHIVACLWRMRRPPLSVAGVTCVGTPGEGAVDRYSVGRKSFSLLPRRKSLVRRGGGYFVEVFVPPYPGLVVGSTRINFVLPKRAT